MIEILYPVLFFFLYRKLFMKRYSVKGKQIVLTGAAGGLGTELSLLLAEKQAHTLILMDISKSSLSDLETQLKNRFPAVRVVAKPIDLKNREQIAQITNEIMIDPSFDIEILINNAGITFCGESFMGISDEQDDAIMQINFLAPLKMIKQFTPYFERKGRGHIVNIASMAAISSGIGMLTYSASKAAVKNFTEGLQAEFTSRNSPVTCSSVCPGIFDSKMFTGFYFPVIGKPVKTKSIAQTTVNEAVEKRIHLVYAPEFFSFFPLFGGLLNFLGFSVSLPYNALKKWSGIQRANEALKPA